MTEITDNLPKLEFLIATPENLMSRPPLCSSLQNLESSFFLVALGKFPHALVTTGSAIESAMKSVYDLKPETFVNAEKLYKKATTDYPALNAFSHSQLEQFRFTRNRIVHYGFSPRDDEETATLLLETGYPFLMACYKEFFGYQLIDSLFDDCARHFGIVLDVYSKARQLPSLHYSYCFHAFGHFVLWSLKERLMSSWESDASFHAETVGGKHEHCQKEKWDLERTFDVSWTFDCPICKDFETFVVELDEDSLKSRTVSLKRAACSSCEFVVPHDCHFLVDTLCENQVVAKHDEILREYGIK